MRNLRVCSSPCPNGVVFGEERCRFSSASPSPSPLPASSPEPCLIREESWERAEKTTEKTVFKNWPSLFADQKRQEIIQYLQGLVRYYTGCTVVPYGSVLLRTHLPDGDIHLTAFTLKDAVDGVVSDVHNVLMREEHNGAAYYKVKDINRIDAEVKLLKCIVEDIAVDICFHQLGGIGALCFLEQVDRLTGCDQLFKRSIFLIKAWCYYESRILGVHHGLISSYALETLVLYIFHHFHNSLKGPLSVLYVFFDYFSKFDWDNYCVSLNGPVCKSSLPYIAAVVPKGEKDVLLLSEEFLQNCRCTFSLSSYALDTNLRAFPLKHLNIIDPLEENNNLGCSVNRGNFYRIRGALNYGACKLGWILSLPEERIPAEVKKFFANTMIGLGNNCLKNGQHVSHASGVESDQASEFLLNLQGDYHKYFRNLQYWKCCLLYSTSPPMISCAPLGPRCYPASSFSYPCDGFGEENKRIHGRGTCYLNSMQILHSYTSGRFPGRGGSLVLKGHAPLDIHTCINGLAAGSPEVTASADCRHMVSDPVLGSGRLASLGCDQSNLSVGESFYTKSYSCPSEKLKHGSLHPQKSFSAPLPESDLGTFTHRGPALCPMASPMKNCKPFLNSDQERVKAWAYHLRNEDHFHTVNLSTK